MKWLVKKGGFAALLCLCASGPVLAQDVGAPSNHEFHYVRSILDYRLHMELHRRRIFLIGVRILNSHGHAFPNLSSSLLYQYFDSKHDLFKVFDHTDFLDRMNIRDAPVSFAEELSQKYGLRFRDLPEDERTQAFQTVTKMNEAENELARIFFEKQGWAMIPKEICLDFFNLHQKLPVSCEFQVLEHIADVIDRAHDPVADEELNGSEPEEKWLQGRSLVIAQKLRGHYDRNRENYEGYLEVVGAWSYDRILQLFDGNSRQALTFLHSRPFLGPQLPCAQQP